MTLRIFLRLMNEHTFVEMVVRMYGRKFETRAYAGELLENEDAEELLNMIVQNAEVHNGTLKVYLEKEAEE